MRTEIMIFRRRITGLFTAKKLVRVLALLLCILITERSSAQSMSSYFATRGVSSLADASHPANLFLKGSYNVTNDYVDVFITSQDNILEGKVYTELRLIRGIGIFSFRDIIVRRDTDPWARPFDALKLQANIILVFLQSTMGEEKFNEMLAVLKELYGEDITEWSGKTWALAVLNADYNKYSLE